MNSITIIYITIIFALMLVLAAFGVFSIGFLLGFKNEEYRIIRKKQRQGVESVETQQEIKAKKDLKKFFEYDGSVQNTQY